MGKLSRSYRTISYRHHLVLILGISCLFLMLTNNIFAASAAGKSLSGTYTLLLSPMSDQCSDHGTYNITDSTCSCDEGYTGDICAKCIVGDLLPDGTCSPPTTGTSDPVIFFSDIVSAPGKGWSTLDPDKGAVITVWGRNFGLNRGSSYVTVNGVKLDKDTDYVDDWAKTSNPTPFLQTITFQLNNTMSIGDGSITVTIDGVTSNSLAFRINTSKIFFVDVNATGEGAGSLETPFSNPMSFINQMQEGDVVYFREGLYVKEYDKPGGSGKSVIYIRDEYTPGTEKNPISFVSYPGEVAHMDTLIEDNISGKNRGFQVNVDYITIAKFKITAHLRAIWSSHYNRVIGNDVTGVVGHSGGDGAIHTGSEGPVILGNSVHGARSENKLDHAIYIDGCQDVTGGEIAYNYVWDNNVAVGPLVVDNHQNTRCATDKHMKSNHWHHNVISAENYKSRGLGIYDLSWDDGEATKPDPAYVYNNIFIECGDGWSGALYHNNGYAYIYNNTFYNSQGSSIQLYNNASDEKMLGATIVNNVFIQKSGTTESGIAINETKEDVSIFESRVFVDHNYYENSVAYTHDANAVVGEKDGSSSLAVNSKSLFPVLIVDPKSPLIDAGSDVVSDIVNFDFYGLYLFTNYDLGAVEYQAP